MATSAVLRYNMNKITCYLDHARVAKCSASSGFNSVMSRIGCRMNRIGYRTRRIVYRTSRIGSRTNKIG